MFTIIVFEVLAVVAILIALSGVRIVNQVERGVVFRFGRALPCVRRPGLTLLIPLVDRLKKVNVQIVTMPVPTQEGITRDNVSVKVDAVVYFRVQDPMRAAIEVQNYLFAVEQVAQTSLRSIIGKSELDDLLTNREELNRGLALTLDSPALGWGIHIDRVEIKDVQLPEAMKRSMSRQAEAERERRARVITADGEFQAARRLADASAIMDRTPGALQLRLLQTVVEVAAEKSSTLVMPFPVELLRFFDRAAHTSPAPKPAVPEPAERIPAGSPAPAERIPAGSPAPELSPPDGLQGLSRGRSILERETAEQADT
ncbi:slipin family protein [Streptosporangium fragile]|uniref:Slipin family protein n=1 Tax=Streptosporangium fragile TaxID=46186 RepID=A0ABN3W7H6_9ACTN